MNAQQKVFRVRRNYNRWVANQTLEDYALRFTAKRARKWSTAQVATTALGAISFLALEAIGGAITLGYGFTNAVLAIVVVGLIIFLTGLPISYHAAKQGTDIDLLTRGAGFGYIGSTITSLIYASFTFIFFALEAAIMSLALELTLGIPLTIGYFISAVVVIPLVTHGITLISRFQVWTQPLWIALQLLPLVVIALQLDEALTLWTDYRPGSESAPPLQPAADELSNGTFQLAAFGAASAVLFSLIAQIGEQVDFLRFLPHEDKPSWRWWVALLAAGPGWILVGALKILIGSFLAVLALSHGIPFEEASDPNRMYLVAFGYLTDSPELTLVLVGLFVVLSQLKINVTNAYAGSIAWSNFFSRLTHNHPGRVVWLVFNVAIALMLMELGIYRVLEEILGVYAILALAWVGALVADLVINRPLGLRPPEMEFRRAHLYDINPVGVGSMAIASIAGFLAHLGVFGETPKALASFIALGSTFLTAPLIAWATGGRYYIARQPVFFRSESDLRCCICNHRFETEDMSHCPAYAGPICSLCCSLDSRCHDQCKQNARLAEQLTNALSVLLPSTWVRGLNTTLGHFLGLFLLTSFIIAALLALVYVQIGLEGTMDQGGVASALINVFFILLIVSGVVAWMFALVQESRRVAQEESSRQTELLIAEIEAHKQTDLELQHAKEIAEAANSAKSRYLTGISHELRSPLNAILGYAQLLEKDAAIPAHRREAITVIRRSGDYLSDLIEGLLDISRIEAGRLERVRTDEKRLRQILINLVSNAVKYTQEGQVTLSVRYRNQVAEFSIRDTGIGIAPEDMETIFKPFERLRQPGDPYVAGTGLGLTITRLLTDIMGGEITVESHPGKGSLFRVSLMLPRIDTPDAAVDPERTVLGYEGGSRTVFVVDDDPTHRALLADLLTPLGFHLLQAADGPTCLDMLRFGQADIYLLDVFMPGMSGWQLAREIRQQQPQAVILMISANAHEEPPDDLPTPLHDAYLVKPIRLQALLEKLARHAGIAWTRDRESPGSEPPEGVASDGNRNSRTAGASRLPEGLRQELVRLAQIGYANGLKSRLDQLIAQDPEPMPELQHLRELAGRFQFAELIRLLTTIPENSP